MPPHHGGGFVEQWFAPEQEPMKDAIGAPQSNLAFALPVQISPVRQQFWKVFGMNRGLLSPAVRLFRGETGEVTPFLINEFHGAVRMT